MLVLSRKKGEILKIGDNMEVTVLSINGNRVKLGFSGPSDMTVYRGELAEKKNAEVAARMELDPPYLPQREQKLPPPVRSFERIVELELAR